MVVEYACTERVARIHLARPERLNAVVPVLVDGLIDALDRAHDEANVIVLAGRGRAFCAGHDLKEPVPVETLVQTRVRLEQIQEVTRRIRSFPGIVISAVHGYALGAGCEFALGCDLVVADETARFGFPEVGVGLSVTGGISALLPKIVGPYRAKELLLTGRHLDATEAASLGLVNRLASLGAHEQVALGLAREINTKPPTAASLAKQVVDLGLGSTLEEALATEVDHALITSVSGEGDAPRGEFGR
ncbi:MAG: enoyl-CoA hydratase/isomerase family protein [Nocardioidaceae bacterium]